MQLWVLAYASGAIVAVFAQDREEARRLALAELADKAPRVDQVETAAVPHDVPASPADSHPCCFLRPCSRCGEVRALARCRGFARAAERIRTADPFITSEVLYQLSYGGEVLGGEW